MQMSPPDGLLASQSVSLTAAVYMKGFQCLGHLQTWVLSLASLFQASSDSASVGLDYRWPAMPVGCLSEWWRAELRFSHVCGKCSTH